MHMIAVAFWELAICCLRNTFETLLPLLPVFVICLNTAVHDPAGGAVEHHAVSIHAVSAQPAHGAVLPHAAPCLHMLLLAP